MTTPYLCETGMPVGVCGRCGDTIKISPILDYTYHRFYAKCVSCGCLHGQLIMNLARFTGPKGRIDLPISEAMFWNPIF